MSQPGRVIPAALALRALVSVGAVLAILAALASYVVGLRPLGPGFGTALLGVVAAGAASRWLGVALPGQGFSSYIVGVGLFALLHRGWPFAALTLPFAILLGDLALRQLALRRALLTAAHTTAGAALVGLAYEALGGTHGAAALDRSRCCSWCCRSS
jgi:hypothetical protein